MNSSINIDGSSCYITFFGSVKYEVNGQRLDSSKAYILPCDVFTAKKMFPRFYRCTATGHHVNPSVHPVTRRIAELPVIDFTKFSDLIAEQLKQEVIETLTDKVLAGESLVWDSLERNDNWKPVLYIELPSSNEKLIPSIIQKKVIDAMMRFDRAPNGYTLESLAPSLNDENQVGEAA